MKRVLRWVKDFFLGSPPEEHDRVWVQRTRKEAVERLQRIKTEAEAYLR